ARGDQAATAAKSQRPGDGEVHSRGQAEGAGGTGQFRGAGVDMAEVRSRRRQVEGLVVIPGGDGTREGVAPQVDADAPRQIEGVEGGHSESPGASGRQCNAPHSASNSQFSRSTSPGWLFFCNSA